MIRRLLAFAAGLLTSACCTSLPRVAQTHAPLPVAPVQYDRTESSDVWRDEKRGRDVPVKLYVPAGSPSTKFPVVVFSHGIGEDRDSYAYLGEALAARGFLAVHVTHAGTDRAVLERGYRHLYRAVKERANWVARPLDVSFVLDRLASHPNADLERVAVAGHSAGAFTAFAVAGLVTASGGTLPDARVKVAIPMSMPRMDEVVAEGGYDAIAIPVLNVTGTCDTSIIYRTFPRHRRVPFEVTRARQQYLVTLEGVTHDSFSNREDPHHERIVALTVAFLRGFLLHDAQSRAWFESEGIADALGARAAVEAK